MPQTANTHFITVTVAIYESTRSCVEPRDFRLTLQQAVSILIGERVKNTLLVAGVCRTLRIDCNHSPWMWI